MNPTNHLNKLIKHQDLTATETQSFLEGVISGKIPASVTGAILTALRMKEESVDEIIGLIQVMRKHMIRIHAPGAIDVCGTGGDKAGTFNISTAVSLVAAGAGIKVAKHGNRAASSKCGAADVLEAMGVNIMLKPIEAQAVLEKVGTVFLFAPLYHPATKNVVAVRKELKIRTVFNFLGPFLNPASSLRQLMGVLNPQIAKKLANVAKKLKYKHLLLVSGADGLDEISISSQTIVYEVKGNTIKKFTIDPDKFGFKKATIASVQGGTAEYNAKKIQDVLTGITGPTRDIVVLNAAAALYVAGKTKTIKEGVKLAKQSIDSGRAKRVLENLIMETQKYA